MLFLDALDEVVDGHKARRLINLATYIPFVNKNWNLRIILSSRPEVRFAGKSLRIIGVGQIKSRQIEQFLKSYMPADARDEADIVAARDDIWNLLGDEIANVTIPLGE